MPFFRDNMKYIDFNIKNPRCIHCYISDRAYASVITEVMANGQNETGGVFLGYIINRAWYIVESVDPGVDTVNQVAFFEWDSNYVNHQAKRLGKIYNKPLTILGFWHRHPGSMDYFSGQDETTIRTNLRELRAGLLSMLVNIDPKLRMTYYYCYGNEIMPIRYDVGNKYFPAELLQYADADELSRRAAESGRNLEIHYEQVINLEAIAAKKRNTSVVPNASMANAGNKNEDTVTDEKKNNTSVSPEHQPEYLSNETIKRIVEVVVGIEGDKNGLFETVAEKINDIDKTLADFSVKMDQLLETTKAETESSVVKPIDENVIEEIVKTTIQTLSSEKTEDAMIDKATDTSDEPDDTSCLNDGEPDEQHSDECSDETEIPISETESEE